MSTKNAPPRLPSTQRSLPIALTRARETVMAPIREMLSETGITEQQWRVLRVLSESPGLDATKLARQASLHQPSLTRILRSLTERGLIERTTHQTDRRRQVVQLTAAGAQVIADNLAEATRIADALHSTLGPARYDTLLDLLALLEDFEMDHASSAPHARPDQDA